MSRHHVRSIHALVPLLALPLLSACAIGAPEAADEERMLRGTSDYETELNEGLIDWSNDQGNPDGTIALGNGTLAFQDATGGISAYTPAMWIAEGTTGYSCDSAMANCIQLGPQASIECGPSGVGDCFCECDELWDCASMILYDCEKHLAYWPDSGTFTCNHDGEC